MRYIWINPVSEHMYKARDLRCFLERNSLIQVRCMEDWGAVVKAKYEAAVSGTEDTVADARCPMAAGLVEDYLKERQQQGKRPSLRLPGIEPILLHCAREISGREDLKDREKIITTPCQALADAGNGLGLNDTWFVTWNGLLKFLGDTPETGHTKEDILHGNIQETIPETMPGGRKNLDASPIPPGFFDSLKAEKDSLTGSGRIRGYLEEGRWEKVRLMELLYCDMGCHNGDGVAEDED